MLVVAHDAVIMTVRYVCERLSELEVLELARRAPVRNAAVTRLVREDDGWDADGRQRGRRTSCARSTPVTQHAGDRDALPH